MGKSITLYVDGSSGRLRGNPKPLYSMGWGVVAHFDGKTVEQHGSRQVEQYLYNNHELAAFIEAMLFAQAQGFAFEDMTFFTDDDQTAYAGCWFHPENGRGIAAERVQDRLKQLCQAFHSDEVYAYALDCLSRARFQRVVSHLCTVDHNRVDYLARTAMNRLLNKGDGTPMEFETWLAQGFEFRENAEDAWVWYPPFLPIPQEQPATASPT